MYCESVNKGVGSPVKALERLLQLWPINAETEDFEES